MYVLAHLPFTTSSVQPGFGIGFTAMTPSGTCRRSITVGDPAQPCGTLKTAS